MIILNSYFVMQSRLSCIEWHQDDMWIWGERLISINLLSSAIMSFRSLTQTDGKHSVLLLFMPRRSLLGMMRQIRYEVTIDLL
jgi:hypothetical protein